MIFYKSTWKAHNNISFSCTLGFNGWGKSYNCYSEAIMHLIHEIEDLKSAVKNKKFKRCLDSFGSFAISTLGFIQFWWLVRWLLVIWRNSVTNPLVLVHVSGWSTLLISATVTINIWCSSGWTTAWGYTCGLFTITIFYFQSFRGLLWLCISSRCLFLGLIMGKICTQRKESSE